MLFDCKMSSRLFSLKNSGSLTSYAKVIVKFCVQVEETVISVFWKNRKCEGQWKNRKCEGQWKLLALDWKYAGHLSVVKKLIEVLTMKLLRIVKTHEYKGHSYMSDKFVMIYLEHSR